MKIDLSLITINLNNFDGLLKTLSSLKNLKKFQYEHIIVDGKSNDFLTPIHFLSKIYSFNFISEIDNGIYNAMNKGISMSSYNRLLFLNSGDYIVDYIKFESFISECCNIDLVYSNVLNVNINGSISESRYPDTITLDYMICYGLPHQATIINKSLFNKIGLYNEKYKIISDWVFFMEALFYHNATYKHVDEDVIYFDGSGISNQKKHLRTIIKEQVHYISLRFPQKLVLYKTDSPYVKKYFRQIPRWKRYFLKFIFQNFNHI